VSKCLPAYAGPSQPDGGGGGVVAEGDVVGPDWALTVEGALVEGTLRVGNRSWHVMQTQVLTGGAYLNNLA